MTLYPSILAQVLITIVAARGVYTLTGLTGMFSLGQAAFMAAGSYIPGILVIKCGFPPWLACILAVLIAVVIGYLVGFPTVRLHCDYISFATLGFGEAIIALPDRAIELTSGASGFVGIPRRTAFPLALVSAIAAVTIVGWLKTSRYGRQYTTVRGDELATKAMGINVPKIKMSVSLLSVAVMAFSGCLYAFFITYVDPTIFGWKKSADWVIMVFFSGVNSLTGPVVSAFILSGLPGVPRSPDQYRNIIYAILVLLIINLKPSGISGEWELSSRDLRALGEKLTKRSRKEEKTDGAA